MPTDDIDPELLAYLQTLFGHARSGDVAALEHAMGLGVSPNLRNEKGDTLLMLATYYGHVDAVRALLDKGADPNLANDKGQTPLAGAAFKGDLPMVELLLSRNAQVGEALELARSFGHAQVAALLENAAAPKN